MLETLAEWFEEGGWSSLVLVAWLLVSAPIALGAIVSSVAKWRAATLFGVANLVLASCMLATGLLGVHTARTQTHEATEGNALAPSVKLRLLQANYEESKGGAKLALVFSLPLLFVGTLAIRRRNRVSVPGDAAGDRRRRLRRYAINAASATAAVGFGATLILVSWQGRGALDPGLVELYDAAHTIEPLSAADPHKNEILAYDCDRFEKSHARARAIGLDVGAHDIIPTAKAQCDELKRQELLDPSLFLSPTERARIWKNRDQIRVLLGDVRLE